MVCKECDSKRVMVDAWAIWSVKEQQLVLGHTFDHIYCQDCGGETDTILKPYIAESL